MSKNTVDKVIKIALAEVGYLEKSASAYKKNPKVLDSKTEGAGSDNYTKYGRDMHKVYPAVMDFPAYWCDCFTDWCFYTAYGISTAKSLLGGNFDDYTVASCQMYKNKGALNTTPKKGAQVFFTKNGQVSGCHHTGLVVSWDGTYFDAVEGNTSGASGVVRNGGGVARKRYKLSDYKGKVLFGHPKYDVDSSVKKETTEKVASPTLKKGNSGAGVKLLQKNLNKVLSYGLAVDGVFGDKTYNAVVKFQRKYGLSADGIYGEKTYKKMKSLIK